MPTKRWTFKDGEASSLTASEPIISWCDKHSVYVVAGKHFIISDALSFAVPIPVKEVESRRMEIREYFRERREIVLETFLGFYNKKRCRIYCFTDADANFALEFKMVFTG